jgi:hypothetical protein
MSGPETITEAQIILAACVKSKRTRPAELLGANYHRIPESAGVGGFKQICRTTLGQNSLERTYLVLLPCQT